MKLRSITIALPEDARPSLAPLDCLWEPRDPGLALWGRGAAAELAARGPDRIGRLIAAAAELFDDLEDVREPGAEDAPPPLVTGGLSFEPSATWPAPWRSFGDASFLLPRWLVLARAGRRFLRLTTTEPLEASRARLRLFRKGDGVQFEKRERSCAVELNSVPLAEQRAAWGVLVEDALDRLARGEVDKLVAARCSVVRSHGPIDPARVVARLRAGAASHEGTLFVQRRGDATFLGLSPERLVAREGARVRTEALAGTGANAAALSASVKDRHEHAIVVEAVRAALAPLCSAIEAPTEPLVRSWPGLCHLWTPIDGRLERPRHVLELVERLHPTPAVAGAPADRARAWIAAHEPIARGWYAGPIGWFDANGDGDLAVAIRSAAIVGDRAWIWAGAGLVAASRPELEWAETSAKQEPMLRALGVPA